MNTVESYSTTDPHGKEDVCAKFTIDNIDEAFKFPNVAIVDKEYTFSCWVRSEAAGSVSICSGDITTTTEWTRQAATFTAPETDLWLVFNEVGTYYIYHAQLELGNKATDWTPAPEDVDQSIADTENKLQDEMITQYADLMTTCEGIFATIGSVTELRDDYTNFKTTTETAISAVPGQIEIKFTEVEETTKGYVDGELESYKEEVSKHITLGLDTAITISSGSNAGAITLELDNEKGIIFKKNGVEFGSWDGVDFHTGNIVVDVEERAQLGNFAFIPRSDGSLSFLKVGGE